MSWKKLLTLVRRDPTSIDRAQADNEVDDELLFHLRSLVDENMARGMSHEEAWDDAQRRFGSLRRYWLGCRRVSRGRLVPALVGAVAVVGLMLGWWAWESRQASRMQDAARQAETAARQPGALQQTDLTGRIVDRRGKPIAGADVLVVVKTWPGGWFRQDDFATQSDADGRFRLAGLIPQQGQFAIQIAALKDGYALTSSYQMKREEDDHALEPVVLKLDDAAALTLVVHDADGRPVPGARVVPSARRSAAGEEHLLYFQGSKPVQVVSNAAGHVPLLGLERGDHAEIYVRVPDGDWKLHSIEVPSEGDRIEVAAPRPESTADQQTSTRRAGVPVRLVSVTLPDAQREKWNRKLAALKKGGNWRSAFALGLQLADLAPDEGFAILEDNWLRIEAEAARQQILKAWVNTMPYPLHARNHPRLLDVLNLGMHDPSPEVREWALNYVLEVALADFSDDLEAYEAWYATNRRKPVVQVVGDSARRFVAQAANMDDPKELADLLGNVRYTFRDTPEARAAAIDAGLPQLVEQWIAAAQRTDASRGQIDVATKGIAILGYLEPSVDDQRRVLVPLLEKPVPLGMCMAATYALGRDDRPESVQLLVDTVLDQAADATRDPASLAMVLRSASPTFGSSPIARRAAKDRKLASVIQRCAASASQAGATSGEIDRAAQGLGLWRAFEPSEEDLRRVVLPLLGQDVPSSVRTAAIGCLARADCRWAVDPLVDVLKQAAGQQDERGVLWRAASALAAIGDPRAIPPMIAAIEGDNTYDTVYGVGYFGLGKMTGVKYDEKHDGAWWRAWWEENKGRFQEAEDSSASQGGIKVQQVAFRVQDDVADVPAEDLHAGGDPKKRYFLIGGGENAAAPADGYKLLFVLPGGDGGANFHPFVKRIYKYAFGPNWLLIQPVAPEWDKNQFERLVWPTIKSRYPAAKFTTEAFIAAILEDVQAKVNVDPRSIFMLGWSSGGPPVYSTTLVKKSPITGAFVAMSIFVPSSEPPLEGGKGKAFYLLQSPEDRVTKFFFAERAEKALQADGAKVKLERYPGGHGWRGDVFGMIRDGVTWLEENTATAN